MIKKGDQQHVFSTQLKLNMSEMKESKNWKFYIIIYTVKNVSTASHKLPHFLSEHVFIVKIKNKKFGAARLIFVETGREKPGGE